MPRDSNGDYSLPAGNPVVTLTVISSTWANTTMSDISTALTGSLDRSGQGAMLAGLKAFDGVIGAPGYTWGTETTSGIYRNAAGDFRFAIGGVDVFRFATGGSIGLFGNGAVGTPAISWVSESTSGFYRAGAADFRYALGGVDFIQWTTNLEQISGTAPVRRWNESDAAANNRLWDIIASGEDLNFRVLTDALAATNWLTVARTAGVVDSLTFAATAMGFNGQLTLTKTGGGTDAALIVDANGPAITLREADAAVNNRYWDIVAVTEQLNFRLLTDANVGTSYMTVDRTAGTVDSVNFPTNLQYGGVEVGFRPLNTGTSGAGNFSLAQADGGLLSAYTGAGGHTITLATLTSGTIVTIINAGTGSCTLSPSTGLDWFNGSGTISTGNRTLAVGGVATVRTSGGGNWRVWGVGLS